MKDNEENLLKIVEKGIISQMSSIEYNTVHKGTNHGEHEKKHIYEVLSLVKEFWENQESTPTPVALQIAALTHDSDRLYPSREVNTKNCPKQLYDYRKGIHAGTTALLFYEHFSSILPLELIQDVGYLILRHEKGGDIDAENNLLNQKDRFTQSYNLNQAANYLYYADKVSFFNSNIYDYARRGAEKLKHKVMFSIDNLPNQFRKQVLTAQYNQPEVQKVIDTVRKEQGM